MDHRKQRILLVSPYFFPEGGGLEKYAYSVAKNLAAKYEFYVICGTRSQENIKARVESFDNLTVKRLAPNFFVSNTPISFPLYGEIKKIIITKEIDLIHAHTPVPFFVDVAGLAARKFKIPLVVTFHGSSLKKGPGHAFTNTIAFFYERIQRFNFKRAEKIVTVSKKVKEGYLKEFQAKIEVIPPGVEIFEEPVLAREEKSLLFVTQFQKGHAKIKGFDFLLSALREIKKEIPEIKLYVAGHGEELEFYREQVKEKNLKNYVNFLGQINEEEMRSFMGRVQALLVPSMSETEGTPLVILEAFSCGTPVVGSLTGGIPELAANFEDSLLFERGNTEEFKAALKKIIDSRDLRNNLGTAGKNKVAAYYNWRIAAAAYDEIFQKLFYSPKS